jgi:hypothetical protein
MEMCSNLQSWLDYEESDGQLDFEWDWDRICKDIESVWNDRDKYRDEIVAWVQSLAIPVIEKLREKCGDQFPQFFDWVDSIIKARGAQEILLLSPGS